MKIFIDTANIPGISSPPMARGRLTAACGLALLSVLVSSFVFAEESKKDEPGLTVPIITESSVKEPIVVNGDSVEYLHERKEVIGTGNVSINYKDVVLTCDKITVDLNTKLGTAEGNVKVTQKDSFFTGDRIEYNFDNKEAKAIDGYVSSAPFAGRADDVTKPANKDQYKLKRGYLTTCDLDRPHWRVQARTVEIYPNDKVVAKHILVYAGGVPVFYFPYFSQSLKDTKTHINIMPGQDDIWGYFVLGSLRYHFADQAGDILVDYRSKLGLAGGVNHYYKIKGLGEGAVKVYYTRERNKTVFDKVDNPSDLGGTRQLRYRYQVRHKWQVDEDTLAIFNFDKLSDPSIIKDYFENEYDEMGEVPDNYFSFLTTKQDFSTELLFRKRFDKFFNVTERLPEYKIIIPNTRILDTGFYYNGEASGVYLNKTFDTHDVKDEKVVRFDTYNRLTYGANFFRTLSIAPYVANRETYYSRNMWGNTNELRSIFEAGVDTSVKFYRLFDVNTNFLKLDINKIRHIITPTANYYYRYQPSISPNNLFQFDGIDALDTQNGVNLSLENRLQTKRHQGGEFKSVDLATFIISTNYVSRLKRNGAWNEGKISKFSNPVLTLELFPYSFAYLKAEMTVDSKKYCVRTNKIDATISGGNASLDIGYQYEKTDIETRNYLTWNIVYRLNDKWKFRILERFNPYKGEGAFMEHEFTVIRDLHCWQLEFIYSNKPYLETKDSRFWFVMRLKAFPDTPIGYQRVYARNRFGAVGATDSVDSGL